MLKVTQKLTDVLMEYRLRSVSGVCCFELLLLLFLTVSILEIILKPNTKDQPSNLIWRAEY